MAKWRTPESITGIIGVALAIVMIVLYFVGAAHEVIGGLFVAVVVALVAGFAFRARRVYTESHKQHPKV